MKNEARREEPEETGTSPTDAPDALRFPPRERPTTVRRTQQSEPFDVQQFEREREEEIQAKSEQDLAAERERERNEREQAVLDARAALSENRRLPHLDSVVWEAHEAIQDAREKDDGERPNYVPIASASKLPGAESGAAAPGAVYVAPYNLPEYSQAPEPRFLDVLRRMASSLTALAFAAATVILIGTGLDLPATFSTSAAGLAPLAPAGLAWPLTALGLVIVAGHSWWPDQRSARRQRAVGPSLIIASVAGAAWSAAAAYDLPLLALIASLVMMAAAFLGVHQLNLLTARNTRERWLTDAPLETTLGWSAFAACWSASAWVSSWGVDFGPAVLWGVLAVAAALVPVFLMGASERGRMLPAAGFGWGALWLLVASIWTGSQNVWLMLVALVGTLVCFLAAMARRTEIGRAERKA